MKRLRQPYAAAVLTALLTIPAFAGEIGCPVTSASSST